MAPAPGLFSAVPAASYSGDREAHPTAPSSTAGFLTLEFAATSSVTIPEDDPFANPSFGLTAVGLQSMWTANDKGAMQAITGLRHVFGEPTAEPPATRHGRVPAARQAAAVEVEGVTAAVTVARILSRAR